MYSTKAIRLALALGWKYEQFVRPDQATDYSVQVRDHKNTIRAFSLKDRHILWELMDKLNIWVEGFDTIQGRKYHIIGFDGCFDTPGEAIYEAAMSKLGAQDA